KYDAHLGPERLRVGPGRVEFLPACDADHVRVVRTLAGRADLKRPLRGGGRSRRARRVGGHYVGERRILGPRRCLFALRLAHPRPPVGRGGEPGSGPQSSDACWLVNRASTTEQSKEARYVTNA